MIEKTVQDMVTALAVIVNAEAGTWDRAAAYFYGAPGKFAYTIYGRAEKRCANYGTCNGQGGEASVNTAIGQALTANDAATVIKYIKVLYCQNVLRSANKIDQNMDDPIEIIGEGQAFWRILAPWMTAHSTEAAKIFDRMFSTVLTPRLPTTTTTASPRSTSTRSSLLSLVVTPTLRPQLLAASMNFPPACNPAPPTVMVSSRPPTVSSPASSPTPALTPSRPPAAPTTSAALSNSPRL
jgi:hypothetical protein